MGDREGWEPEGPLSRRKMSFFLCPPIVRAWAALGPFCAERRGGPADGWSSQGGLAETGPAGEHTHVLIVVRGVGGKGAFRIARNT